MEAQEDREQVNAATVRIAYPSPAEMAASASGLRSFRASVVAAWSIGGWRRPCRRRRRQGRASPPLPHLVPLVEDGLRTCVGLGDHGRLESRVQLGSVDTSNRGESLFHPRTFEMLTNPDRFVSGKAYYLSCWPNSERTLTSENMPIYTGFCANWWKTRCGFDSLHPLHVFLQKTPYFIARNALRLF